MQTSHIFQVLVIVCLAQNIFSNPFYSNCYSHVSWGEILESMEGSLAQDCPKKNITELCSPEHMLCKVMYHKKAIIQILNEMIRILKRKNSPLPKMERIRMDIYAALDDLHTLEAPSELQDNSPVKDCFIKVNSFLDTESDSRPAWESVLRYLQEILRRVENCSSRCK